MVSFEVCGEHKSLYQWDVNRCLVVHEECNEVHFANCETTTALVAAVEEKDGHRVVNIPNSILRTAGLFKAYAYVCGEDERFTKVEVTFRVVGRPKPDDYVYTEDDVITIKTVVDEAIREAKESGEFDGDMFVARYGETSFDEIKKAWDAGKSIAVFYRVYEPFYQYDSGMDAISTAVGFSRITVKGEQRVLSVNKATSEWSYTSDFCLATRTHSVLHRKGMSDALTPEDIDAVRVGNESIFIAVYGETPYEDVKAAYNAGKALVLRKDGVQYPFNKLEGSTYSFSINRYDTFYNYWCNPWAGWDGKTVKLPI